MTTDAQPPLTICIEEGCNEPRYASASGVTVYPRCEKHSHAQWRVTEAKRYIPASKKPPRQQRAAPAPSTKFVLIDEERGEVWRVVAVLSHSHTPAADLNPHVLPALKHGGDKIVYITATKVGAT